MELLALREKPEKFFIGPILQESQVMSSDKSMFEGKNIHSSPVDGKLLCSYSEKVCMQRRLNGFAFCIRHILEDKGAPFKQCRFFAKYNKSRCINPVPILEKRNYCNSHMQVLGMIPKKLKKKKDGDKCLTVGYGKESKIKELKQNSSNDKRQISEQKSNHHNKPDRNSSRHSQNSSKKANMHSNSNKQHFESMMPPLRWNPYNNMWKKLLDKRKTNNSVAGNISYSSIETLKKLLHECDEKSQDLFKSYMFENVESESLDHEEVPWQTDTTSDLIMLLDDYSEDEIRSRLMHQSAQLRQSIKTRLQDKKMTYTVLNALVSAAKTNAAATANALNSRNGHKNFRNRSVLHPKVKCVSDLMPDMKCSRYALPYSRHCCNHIGYDGDQVLFGKCTAKFAAGPQCAVPVIDLVNERPLCDEHSLKMMISAKRDAAAPPSKRSKKAEKIEKNRPKQVIPKRNLKAQLQKKFAIPNKPKRKPNSHVACLPGEGKNFRERNESLLLQPTIDNEWEIDKIELEQEKDEGMIISPRGYETVNVNGASTGELPFDIDSSSLSSPSLSEDEGHYPLINMGRSHQDSFNFDEDEDMLRNSGFSMGGIPDPRGVTSPTLMQLSTESIPSTLSLGSLCSPPKLSMEKSLFESALPLKQEPSAPVFRRVLNQAYDVPPTATAGRTNSTGPPRLIGNLKTEAQFASRTSLLNSDRYGAAGTTHGTNSVANNHVISSNFNSVASSSAAWAKFTLSTRNEQSSNSGGGFIRVGPSQNSIYSPPFTTPSPRSKSNIFKFENSKTLDNDSIVLPRNPPPPYSTVVQDKTLSYERRYEAEPPLQKVNPDIFLSKMFTVTTSTSS